MWTSAQLKENAKSVLRQNYWISFAAALIPGLITSFVTYWISSMLGIASYASSYSYGNYSNSYYSSGANFSFFGLIFLLAITAFVTGPLTVGTARFFIRAAQGDVQFNYVFSVFSSKSYLNIVLSMFMMNIIIGLWSMLFVIPGIIASLRYYLVPYILAENPDMSYKDALALSTNLTNGQKGNIFVLQLSFIGWYILAGFTCGLGAYFIAPYVQATDAQLFFTLTGRGNQFTGYTNSPMYSNQPPVYPNNSTPFDMGQSPIYPNQPPAYPQQPTMPNYGAQPPVTPTQPVMPNYGAQPPATPLSPAAQPPMPNYGAQPTSPASQTTPPVTNSPAEPLSTPAPSQSNESASSISNEPATGNAITTPTNDTQPPTSPTNLPPLV